MNENMILLEKIRTTFDENFKWGEDNVQSALEVLGDLIYDLQKLEQESVCVDVS